MEKSKFSPSFLNELEKAMEWWQAEHDRAVWEDDNTLESVKAEYAKRAQELKYMGIEPIYWETNKPIFYGTKRQL